MHSGLVEWTLGLSSWIIQDGNYGDVQRGDRLEVAVEFEVEEALALTEASVPSARCHRDSVYDVVGRVVAIEADVWVLDVGISIFSNRAPPRGLAVGDWVAGRAWLWRRPVLLLQRLGSVRRCPR